MLVIEARHRCCLISWDFLDFATVKLLNLLLSSISCDVTKCKFSQVFYRMYFFYFRVITVVLWLLTTVWLDFIIGDQDVAVLNTLVCTPRYLLCAIG